GGKTFKNGSHPHFAYTVYLQCTSKNGIIFISPLNSTTVHPGPRPKERENRRPVRNHSQGFDLSSRWQMALPLLGERVGVRGNGRAKKPSEVKIRVGSRLCSIFFVPAHPKQDLPWPLQNGIMRSMKKILVIGLMGVLANVLTA